MKKKSQKKKKSTLTSKTLTEASFYKEGILKERHFSKGDLVGNEMVAGGCQGELPVPFLTESCGSATAVTSREGQNSFTTI